MSKAVYLLGTIVVVLAVVIVTLMWFVNRSDTRPPEDSYNTAVVEPEYGADFLHNISVVSDKVLSGAVTVTGQARGMYFEASFPVTLTDATGVVVFTVPATATENWMVDDFVPFTFSFDSTQYSNGEYTMTFTQDDPSNGESGRPIKSLTVPVTILN